MECSRFFCKTLRGEHEENFWSRLWKTKSKQNTHNLLLSTILRKRWPTISWKVCFIFFFFSKSVNYVCTVLCFDFQTLKTYYYHIIPLCKQCSSWGQIVPLSLPQTLHLCHTWGFQKQLVHYYFHVQSILYIVF